jgi:hypothetical protein
MRRAIAPSGFVLGTLAVARCFAVFGDWNQAEEIYLRRTVGSSC